MSIRKVSDLDPYLSTELSVFDQSYFEISKLSSVDGRATGKYVSKNITGEVLINAIYSGLSNYFLDKDALSGFSRKLGAIMDSFGGIDNGTTYTLKTFNLDNNVTVNFNNLIVANPISGVATSALWN